MLPVQFAILLALVTGCSGSTPESAGGTIEYYLDRPATNTTTNALILKYSNAAKDFKFMISGLGFETSVPIDTLLPMQESVELSYSEEAIYTINIKVFNSASVRFINDSITWEYSLVKPPKPIITFSAPGTSDGNATMIFRGKLDFKTNAVFLSGDIAPIPSGSWYLLPGDLRLPITVSSGDEKKTIIARYRNIYGNEGPSSTVSIFRKSSLPKNCNARIGASNPTNSLVQRVYLSAIGNGVMNYQFKGDVDPNAVKQFTDSTTAILNLLPGKGTKHVSIIMSDIAQNPCKKIDLMVEYDPNATNEKIAVKDQALWTDDPRIILENSFTYLPSDEPQMYIFGPHVVPDENTHQWLPYQPEVPITLTEIDGERTIFAQFRINPKAAASAELEYTLYLRPRIRFNNDVVTISNMSEMEHVTITGCQQVYHENPYQSSYPCTPQGSTVSAEFVFKDNSTLTKTANTGL